MIKSTVHRRERRNNSELNEISVNWKMRSFQILPPVNVETNYYHVSVTEKEKKRTKTIITTKKLFFETNKWKRNSENYFVQFYSVSGIPWMKHAAPHARYKENALNMIELGSWPISEQGWQTVNLVAHE